MAALRVRALRGAGGDWGSIVVCNLADLYPERVAGLHVNFLTVPPSKGETLPPPSESRARFNASGSGYQQIQSTKPQTVGYLLDDSPAGLAAWIVEKFREWSDCDGDVERSFTKDQLLTNVMLYWVNTAGASAACSTGRCTGARRASPSSASPSRPGSPTTRRSWGAPNARAERRYHIVHWAELDRGGHFAAMGGARPLRRRSPRVPARRAVMPELFDLTGQVALVTGSSHGIGRAIAERMAEHGARVVVSSRTQEVCDARKPVRSTNATAMAARRGRLRRRSSSPARAARRPHHGALRSHRLCSGERAGRRTGSGVHREARRRASPPGSRATSPTTPTSRKPDPAPAGAGRGLDHLHVVDLRHRGARGLPRVRVVEGGARTPPARPRGAARAARDPCQRHRAGIVAPRPAEEGGEWPTPTTAPSARRDSSAGPARPTRSPRKGGVVGVARRRSPPAGCSSSTAGRPQGDDRLPRSPSGSPGRRRGRSSGGTAPRRRLTGSDGSCTTYGTMGYDRGAVTGPLSGVRVGCEVARCPSPSSGPTPATRTRWATGRSGGDPPSRPGGAHATERKFEGYEIVHVDGESFRREMPTLDKKKANGGKTIVELVSERDARDIESQLRILDNEGVWAEVVYDSLGLWESMIKDPELLRRGDLRRTSGRPPRSSPARTTVSSPRRRSRSSTSISRSPSCSTRRRSASRFVRMPTGVADGMPDYNRDEWEPLWAGRRGNRHGARLPHRHRQRRQGQHAVPRLGRRRAQLRTRRSAASSSR